jgi:hypothetical protein
LTAAQRRDFEVVRRKYKSVIDIITYDDLLRRLEFVLKQLASGKLKQPVSSRASRVPMKIRKKTPRRRIAQERHGA